MLFWKLLKGKRSKKNKRENNKKTIKDNKKSTKTSKKLALVRKLYKKHNINIVRVIDNYKGPGFYKKLIGITPGWGKEDEKKLQKILSGTKHHRDFRNLRQYAFNLILNWLVEDLVLIMLRKKGLHTVKYGSDQERELLVGNKVDAVCDLKIIPKNKRNKEIYLEVIANYPTNSGYSSFWEEKSFFDLRDSKYQKLLSKHSNKSLVYIIGIVVAKGKFFLLPITPELKTEFKVKEENFGGKKTVKIDFGENGPGLVNLNKIGVKSFL